MNAPETPLRVEAHPVELPTPPAPYVPPPLALLPSQLKEYVHAAAESLNVDVAFILLPLLSALSSAIGNSRSILLKLGFIQPPVIWTGIIARSGGRKSPAELEACFAVMEHERELMRQNEDAQKRYADEFAQCKSQKGKRGHKPDEPPFLTCTCDDLTIEALSDILATNPRGILVESPSEVYRSLCLTSCRVLLVTCSFDEAISSSPDSRFRTSHVRFAAPVICLPFKGCWCC